MLGQVARLLNKPAELAILDASERISIRHLEQVLSWPRDPASGRRPLSVAPRPFVDELLSSWLGRPAARYRLGVYDLADLYGIDLGERCRPWLLLTELSEVSLTKLSWLARRDVHQLAAMQPPRAWCEGIRCLPYCARCFFLNPGRRDVPSMDVCMARPGRKHLSGPRHRTDRAECLSGLEVPKLPRR